MKQMTRFLLASVITAAVLCSHAHAQLTVAPGGGNKKAVTGERIGLTDVTIHYDRPGVKGREGQVWGKLIHTGYADLGFGTSKAAPWRAGANENTTIEFSTDVKVEGQALPAGKYGFFIAYDPNESTVIFSKNASSWGSFFYNDKEDALRVKVKPAAMDKSVEWLKYEFLNETENTATVALEWEKTMIPFKVEVDNVQVQLASLRRELRSDKGFTWNSWMQAAQYCINHKTNLDEALVWSDKAISEPFIGEKNFSTLATKAQVLELLNRSDEATAIMKEALPLGKITELHGYGRSLVQQKKPKEAFEVFQVNYNKFPNQFTTNMGMARGYSATGNYKKSLEFAQKALVQAPDPGNKLSIENAIKKLQEGKDIN
jgi:tetratricopeptide (TPR) repeat protein